MVTVPLSQQSKALTKTNTKLFTAIRVINNLSDRSSHESPFAQASPGGVFLILGPGEQKEAVCYMTV